MNSGEYKVMGLAPYGEPKYAGLIKEHLIDIRPDGSFALDMSYFDYCVGLRMTSERFHALFGGPPRRPQDPLTQREMDLAASIQAVAEEVVLKLARGIRRSTGQRNLCLAGGVALNCVANGRLVSEGVFERVWIQPAAGDAGGALGAALAAYHMGYGRPRHPRLPDSMKGAYLGPEYSQAEVEARLKARGAAFRAVSESEAIDLAAHALAEGKTVGWHHGRMEFGPRALGARSILADARSPEMRERLNLKVKERESFRPFAPCVRREDLSEWFELDQDSPYMMLVADVKEPRHREIPAVAHLDGSARVQTVHAETNPRFHALLTRFKELTGCPVLIDTSFNVRGEPIVESPEDALRCFLATDLDALSIGDCWLLKSEQDPALAAAARRDFDPD